MTELKSQQTLTTVDLKFSLNLAFKTDVRNTKLHF